MGKAKNLPAHGTEICTIHRQASVCDEFIQLNGHRSQPLLYGFDVEINGFGNVLQRQALLVHSDGSGLRLFYAANSFALLNSDRWLRPF